MDDNITVGHPFFFPTQAVLVDDDPDFLDGVSLMLDNELSYKLFQSANNALEYVNEAHQHVHFLQRCYTNYKTGPLESDSLSHIDIGKIHLEALNGFRFQTCSTVIVDYSMPEMNGLEFLIAMKNPFIKKVLLTGQADMELAIKAFNQQLIDQFIDKHDPNLKQKLNATISTFQQQYFRTSYKLITDPIIANNHDAFLVNTDFQNFFRELRSKLDCIEYYMIDSPHSGFMMVDSKGNCKCLLVYTEEALQSHYAMLEQIGAPAELLKQVKKGDILPGYDDQAEKMSLNHPAIVDWKSYYYPGYEILSKSNYYATLASANLLPEIQGKIIHSYTDFLETNNISQQIMH